MLLAREKALLEAGGTVSPPITDFASHTSVCGPDGSTPPRLAYLGSTKVAGLENLSNDINLAARNALDGIIDYIVATYGYDRPHAYIIASVAVDLRIGQLVDAPNVGVTAILPLDIFEK